jgi:delta24-sterol reductase
MDFVSDMLAQASGLYEKVVDHSSYTMDHITEAETFFPVMLYASMLSYVLYVYGDKCLGYIITHHRWITVIFFLMPVSVILNTLFYARAQFSFWYSKNFAGAGVEAHERRVDKVVKAVKAWKDGGMVGKLTTSRPGWATMSLRVPKYKATSTKIPTMHLNNVVTVDKENMTVHCEPMVTMGQMTMTLEHLGVTIPVLPELDDLTVGGLICGVGVETSSHRHGLFTHSCIEYELVTADGELKKCSETENPELFRAIPWSHGTLGFLVGATMKIVESKPWIRLEYEPYHSKADAIASFKDATDCDDFDFVESLVYSNDNWVVMKGVLVDEPGSDGVVNKIGQYWKPWFFTHVERFLNEDNMTKTEYVPLRDYYHRHTRALFWEMQDIVTFGNHWLFRYTLGWAMPPNVSMLKRCQTEEVRRLYELFHVVQDMLVPLSSLSESIDVMERDFDVYPAWICPMRIFPEDSGFLKPTSKGEEMFVDVGIYGVPGSGSGRPGKTDYIAAPSSRRVEDFVREVEGYQMMYADMYQTREEFREMFDHTLLDKIRAESESTMRAFPEVFDKVNKNARV